jgi:type I restriction enzyme S subunit
VKNNHTPEIRFSGFSGDWEQLKVIDFSEDTFGGGTPKTSIKEYWNGEIPWIQSSDLHEHQVSEVFGKKKITEKGLKSSATKLIPKNSIAVVTRVGVGKIALIQFEYATSQDFLSLGNLKVNEWFGVYSLYNQLQKELNNVQGTSIKGITKNELLDKKINTPNNLDEQTKIGNFFKKLDDTINLHQQELSTLKQIKQGFMQKMFPKEGKSVPEIRFPEFTGDWEEIRLGDRATIKGRLGWKSLKQEEYTVDGPSMIAGRHIKNGVIDWNVVDHIPQWRYDESPEIMLKNGDVIFSKDGSLGNPALISDLNILATINSTMMLVRVDETIDPSFFYQVLRSDKFDRLIYLKVSGSSIPHLFQADMNDFVFIAPKKEEQIKIGKFFKQLDDNLVFHQGELDALKETKKAFLQKMFA